MYFFTHSMTDCQAYGLLRLCLYFVWVCRHYRFLLNTLDNPLRWHTNCRPNLFHLWIQSDSVILYDTGVVLHVAFSFLKYCFLLVTRLATVQYQFAQLVYLIISTEMCAIPYSFTTEPSDSLTCLVWITDIGDLGSCSKDA